MKEILFLISLLLLVPPNAVLATQERVARTFPTSPPQGVPYHEIDHHRDSAKVAVWKHNEKLLLYAEPITGEFTLCGSDFLLKQNGVTYDSLRLANHAGDRICDEISHPVTLELQCRNVSCFDINQAFNLCFDDWWGSVQCFEINPSQVFITHIAVPMVSSVSVGTTIKFQVGSDTDDSGFNYQFWVCDSYGTQNYGQNWQVIQEFGDTNFCEYTFNSPGHFIVVCWIKESLEDEIHEICGFSMIVNP